MAELRDTSDFSSVSCTAVNKAEFRLLEETSQTQGPHWSGCTQLTFVEMVEILISWHSYCFTRASTQAQPFLFLIKRFSPSDSAQRSLPHLQHIISSIFLLIFSQLLLNFLLQFVNPLYFKLLSSTTLSMCLCRLHYFSFHQIPGCERFH